jgi:hypothetical protein
VPCGVRTAAAAFGCPAPPRYTGDVDKVRLGRALGYGTRHAAKTLAAVAEAAAAPSPNSNPATASPTRPARREGNVAPARATLRPGNAGRQARAAGASVWKPLATFSSALWLRVTGTFFGMIALAMANGVWRLRGAVHAPAPAHRADLTHLVVFACFAALFGYFAVSSFVRAHKRERR